MPSTVQVSEKTVNNRDVISFAKEYAGEEHEVMCPTEQGTQVLLDLLSVLNQHKDEPDRFVLIRKGEVGHLDDVDPIPNGDEYKRQAAYSVVESLFDEQTAADAMLAIEDSEVATDGGSNE